MAINMGMNHYLSHTRPTSLPYDIIVLYLCNEMLFLLGIGPFNRLSLTNGQEMMIPNAVEKPQPKVESKVEPKVEAPTSTKKDETITLSDLTYQNLPQKLEQVAREQDEKWVGLNNETTEEKDKIWQIQKEKEQALAQVIKFVAIPSEKSDLFDLLLMAQTAFLSPTTGFYSAAAYYAKYQEALFKAKTLFANEDSFHAIVNNEQQVETQFKQIHKKQPKVGLKPSVKWWISWACGMSTCIIFLITMGLIFG